MLRFPSRFVVSRATVLLCALAPAASAAAQTATPRDVGVRFELNDAQVKGRALEGVLVSVHGADAAKEVASGRTGSDGRWITRLVPGSYQVSYRLDGYVPYTSGATEVREEGQLVTVSLSRMLESTKAGGRDVRVILNWGSRRDQVEDVDSHLACACGAANGHVFYRQRAHKAAGHGVELDVDDTDWGGPETITLRSPAPGSYVYWVHNYSGPPATLGASDVVVRVVIGTEEAGEFPILKGVTRRAWRPFKTIEVSKDGRPTLVRFTEEEIAEGADLAIPGNLQPDAAQDTSTPDGANPLEGPGGFPIPVLVVFAVMALIVVSRILRAITRAAREQGRRR
jgi:hypothetical protein